MATIRIEAGPDDTLHITTGDGGASGHGPAVAEIVGFVRALDPAGVDTAAQALLDSIDDDPTAAAIHVVADAIERWASQ